MGLNPLVLITSGDIFGPIAAERERQAKTQVGRCGELRGTLRSEIFGRGSCPVRCDPLVDLTAPAGSMGVVPTTPVQRVAG